MGTKKSGVNISLATPILPTDKLYPTPSMQDGLSYDDEFDLRLIGCELIQTSGRLLKLPQTAMATGQVLFHRYFYSKSFVKNNMEHYAMAAIFLSTKIEECPRRIRDVMNVFHHIKQVRTGKIIKPMPVDQAYNELKNNVIKAERRILKELGFCVHVKHPHKIIFLYLIAMECNDNELVQKAWNYMNDSLRTDVFLRYSPETIACACIYLSARELQIALPTNPHWFTIFGASEDDLQKISIRLIHMYNHKTKSLEELEKIVNQCRDNLMHEKQRAKEAIHAQNQPGGGEQTSGGTPGAPTSIDTPGGGGTGTASCTPDSTHATSTAAPTTSTATPGLTATSSISSQIVAPTNKAQLPPQQQIQQQHAQQYQQQQQQYSSYHHHQHHHHHHHNNSNSYQYHHSHHHQAAAAYYDNQQYSAINSNIDEHYYMSQNYHNGVLNEIDKRESNNIKSSSRHKRHTKSHSSKNRSKSQSRSRSSSTSPPKHKKRHKKRSSKERNRSRSRTKSRSRTRSRSTSPSRHKKKKYHHHRHKSRSRTDSRYVQPPPPAYGYYENNNY